MQESTRFEKLRMFSKQTFEYRGLNLTLVKHFAKITRDHHNYGKIICFLDFFTFADIAILSHTQSIISDTQPRLNNDVGTKTGRQQQQTHSDLNCLL